MKTETLKIQIPEGYIVDHFDTASGEIKFKAKPKELTDRIKTMEDVIRELGNNDQDVIDYAALVLLFDSKHHILNNQAAILIAKAFNQGWVPDWSNGKYDKYFPWFYMAEGSSGFRYADYDDWNALSDVGSRLAFKNKAHCEYAGKQFIEVYKNFMLIK